MSNAVLRTKRSGVADTAGYCQEVKHSFFATRKCRSTHKHRCKCSRIGCTAWPCFSNCWLHTHSHFPSTSDSLLLIPHKSMLSNCILSMRTSSFPPLSFFPLSSFHNTFLPVSVFVRRMSFAHLIFCLPLSGSPRLTCIFRLLFLTLSSQVISL